MAQAMAPNWPQIPSANPTYSFQRASRIVAESYYSHHLRLLVGLPRTRDSRWRILGLQWLNMDMGLLSQTPT